MIRVRIVSSLEEKGIQESVWRGELTVVRMCTEPNQMAISSYITRSAVHGFCLGAVSMIHWIQSAFYQ